MKHQLQIFLMSLSLIGTLIPTVVAGGPSCQQVEVVFARGSGSPLGGREYTTFTRAIKQTFAQHAPTLSYDFYELGSTPQDGHQYPAVDVQDFGILINTFVSAGRAAQFGQSVATGQAELQAYINHRLQACPDTKFVLSGYSQGAMVISQTLPQLDPAKIIYVATFGDPKLYLPEGYGSNPDACQGHNLSSYRIDVPDCYTDHGILGTLKPYLADGYNGKLGVWCNQADFMCGSYFNFGKDLLSAHLAYSDNGSFTSASRYILSAVSHAYPNQTLSTTSTPTNPGPDVVFLFDTSGSMISSATFFRTRAIQLATKALQQGGRIALYEYRDLKDGFAPRQLCDFSCTLSQFTTLVRTAGLSGGGKTLAESALSASLIAMNSLEWQVGANKSIVILSDDGFLDPDIDGTTLKQVVQRSLEIDPVNFYAVTVGSHTAKYTELTTLTSGQAFRITDDPDQVISTIFDRPEARLSQTNYFGYTGSTFTFDASASTATNPISTYAWDLDGDGIFELTSSSPIAQHTYTSPTSHYAQVKVTDTAGYFSTMSALVTVQDSTPATLTNLSAQSSSTATTFSFATANAAATLIAVNDVALGLTNQNTVTLTDFTPDTTITFTPISPSGQRGTPVSYALSSTPQITTPRTITPQNVTTPKTPNGAPLKVPNAGGPPKTSNANARQIHTYMP